MLVTKILDIIYHLMLKFHSISEAYPASAILLILSLRLWTVFKILVTAIKVTMLCIHNRYGVKTSQLRGKINAEIKTNIVIQGNEQRECVGWLSRLWM
jgi:hypothetical protein